MANALLALTGFLIMYGSLYPFNFTAAPPDVWQQALTDLKLFTGRGDVLGNVGLFVPWGIAGIAVWAPRSSHQKALVKTLVWGFVVAVVAQIGQAWVPSRDPAVGDVLWNMVGCVIGVAISVPVLRRLSAGQLSSERMVAAALLAAWVVGEWLPLVPSLDLQLLKDKLKELISPSDFSLRELVLRAALALLVGQLLKELQFFKSRAQGILGLALLCGAVMAGKFFIQGSHVEFASMLGLAVGVVGWAVLSGMPERQRRQIVCATLLLAYTVASLAPYKLSDMASDLHWIPFEALLEGSMLANVGALVANLVLFGGILHMAQLTGSTPGGSSVLLAIWVLAIELAQMLIPTRNADLTEVLLVLVLGQVLAIMANKSRPASVARRAQTTASAPLQPEVNNLAATAAFKTTSTAGAEALQTPPAPTTRLNRLLPHLLWCAFTALAIALTVRLPFIPYNVRELVPSGVDGIFSVIGLALILHWMANAPFLIMQPQRRHYLLALPLTLIVHGLIGWALLRKAVPAESIHDILGSPVLGWPWEWELLARFVALDAGLMLQVLGGALLVRVYLRASTLPDLVYWLMVALLLTWPLYTVLITWAATDNLTELVRNGSSFAASSALANGLLMTCFCGSALAAATLPIKRRLPLLASAVIAAALAVSLFWLGAEPVVVKYETSFSAFQFLLSTDREHYAHGMDLAVRFIVAFGVVTLGLAALQWFAWRDWVHQDQLATFYRRQRRRQNRV